jgi:P4 family phage/plasmid primase-like protien
MTPSTEVQQRIDAALAPVRSPGSKYIPPGCEAKAPAPLLPAPQPAQKVVATQSPTREAQGARNKHSGPAAGTVAKQRKAHPPTEPEDNRPAEYADDTLALKFTERHGDNLRYTAAWGQWSAWDGHAWRPDATCYVFDLARQICREQSARCEDERLRSRIASAQTVSAVERLARADRRHAATVEQWDANPWALNTPGGIVDLRTGEIRPSDRTVYCTKATAVTPGGDCPQWLEFLARITGGNLEFQSYLQRMAGYSLTGVTIEHALFFLFGHGANGKSVFLNAICGMMGSYAKTASIATFIDTRSESHPTDLAGLQGARLVTAVETEDGRRWAESKLKALTGGDKIAARFMRADFFEFVPAFKLCIAGNHKPGLRSVDEAMRRRFNLVPFEVTIPPAERDLQLGDKLREEWGSILAWAIEGCLAWQAEGLHAPQVVSAATEDYFDAEDALARWLEDRTERRDGAWESATALFTDWKTWADTAGEYAGSQKRFSENLTARGIAQVRTKVARGFGGIRLRANTDGKVVEL